MPRKVTAYACIHGCKRRVVTTRANMEYHEGICYLNEDRRTCATCDLDIREPLDVHVSRHEVRTTVAYGCAGEHKEEGTKLVYDCPHWEPKNDEPWDDEPEWEV